MKVFDVKQIADEADVIINGYAIIKKDEGRTVIVNLNREGHAALLLPSGEVCETRTVPLFRPSVLRPLSHHSVPGGKYVKLEKIR